VTTLFKEYFKAHFFTAITLICSLSMSSQRD